MRAVWRGFSEALGPPLSFLPPCRAPGNQGYSRFPPVAQGKKGQTGQKRGNPRVSPSVGPAGPDSLRLEGRRLEGRKPGARPSLLPFRKVSLGVLTERGEGTPKKSPATSCLPQRGTQSGWLSGCAFFWPCRRLSLDRRLPAGCSHALKTHLGLHPFRIHSLHRPQEPSSPADGLPVSHSSVSAACQGPGPSASPPVPGAGVEMGSVRAHPQDLSSLRPPALPLEQPLLGLGQEQAKRQVRTCPRGSVSQPCRQDSRPQTQGAGRLSCGCSLCRWVRTRAKALTLRSEQRPALPARPPVTLFT